MSDLLSSNLVAALDILGFHEGSAAPEFEGAKPTVRINGEDFATVLAAVREACAAPAARFTAIYPCGCKAAGPTPIPDYCSEHGLPPELRDPIKVMERGRFLAGYIDDANRYRRLRVLGCAPGNTPYLEQGLVLRFTNLDEFTDNDIKAHPDRGEVKALEHGETRAVTRDADHCDYPDCEQHWTYVATEQRKLLEEAKVHLLALASLTEHEREPRESRELVGRIDAWIKNSPPAPDFKAAPPPSEQPTAFAVRALCVGGRAADDGAVMLLHVPPEFSFHVGDAYEVTSVKAAASTETTTAHERELEEVMKERDYAQDVLQDVHIVLGGDGEWKGRLPPQEPPDSGDLHLDVPALARERMAELACWHEQCTGKHGSQMPCVASVKTGSALPDRIMKEPQ